MKPGSFRIAATFVVGFAVAFGFSIAGAANADTVEPRGAEAVSPRPAIHYGSKGLQYQPADSATDLWLGVRFQTRYDTFRGNIVTMEQLRAHQHSGLNLNRGRIKGGGVLLVPWLTVYSEYDFKDKNLLDYRMTATYNGWLSLRAGQWKSEFSRERIDSSGKQQLVER